LAKACRHRLRSRAESRAAPSTYSFTTGCLRFRPCSKAGRERTFPTILSNGPD
jgi:hypothetical protein